MLQQTIDFLHKTKPDYVYMCEAVPYPGTELASFVKELGLEGCPRLGTSTAKKPKSSQTHFSHSRDLKEVKKEFFDHYFTNSYFLRKKLKGDFYSQIMARAALNHLVWNNKAAMWAI